MPNAHLSEMRHRFCKISQILEVEVVTGVDTEARLVGPGCSLSERLGSGFSNGGMLHCERLGVQFDAVGADVGGGMDLGLIGFNEQRRSDALGFEHSEHILEQIRMVGDRPARVACQHMRRIRDQGDLLGLRVANQFHEVVAGISLDVEFCVDHFAQVMDILVRDVPGVGPRVNGDPIRPKRLDARGRLHHIGFLSTPGVAQGRNLVHVDAEPCHTYLWK